MGTPSYVIRPVLRNWQKGVLWTCLQTDGIGETAQGRHPMLAAPLEFPLAFFPCVPCTRRS